MKRFLMCEPKYFDVCYVINPWMAGNLGKVDKARARRQWDDLHRIVSERAKVSLIAPAEGLPDMVFTANAGLVHNNEVIVASFRHAERQPEAAHFERFFLAQGYCVHRLGQDTIFEGAGDGLFDTHGRLWVASGFRSDAHALDEIAAVFDAEVHGLELVDPHWYHLDTAFCPLPDGQALAYKKAFSENSVAALDAAFGANLLWVTKTDAKNFTCNAVVLDHTIIMHKSSTELKAALVQRGLEVIETEMSEFMKSGGSCKCLMLEI